MLQLFKFDSKDVRCFGTRDNPVWIAQDVCECLELTNNRQALARLDDDEKGVILIDTPGGKQDVLSVNEPGLYNLVLGCRKPIAKRFKRWLTHEVLPSIRKTGKYKSANQSEQKALPSLSQENRIRVMELAVYPQEFLPVIVEETEDYCNVRLEPINEA